MSRSHRVELFSRWKAGRLPSGPVRNQEGRCRSNRNRQTRRTTPGTHNPHGCWCRRSPRYCCPHDEPGLEHPPKAVHWKKSLCRPVASSPRPGSCLAATENRYPPKSRSAAPLKRIFVCWVSLTSRLSLSRGPFSGFLFSHRDICSQFWRRIPSQDSKPPLPPNQFRNPKPHVPMRTRQTHNESILQRTTSWYQHAWSLPNKYVDLGHSGYRSTGSHSMKLDVGNYSCTTVSSLLQGGTYYFAATAYDASGYESPLSSPEVSTAIPDTSPPDATITWPPNGGSLKKFSNLTIAA